MTQLLTRSYWSGPRLFALAVSLLIAAVFIGANAHLVIVSFNSQSECVLKPQQEGAATLRAAKPSC
ncbi:MAG: hypothetical protein L0G27_00260 [Paracoccus sp. (in: a-proteobacteria)]|mgnify:CR=1 FL=1|nr:hypothetical protein [Paracoccus sp. (in: a-proteobacteria)]